MGNLQCMLQRDNSNLLLAGHQDHMIEVDLKRGAVTGEVLCLSWDTCGRPSTGNP